MNVAGLGQRSPYRMLGQAVFFLLSVISRGDTLPAKFGRECILVQLAVLQAACGGPGLSQIPSGNRRPQSSGVCAPLSRGPRKHIAVQI